MEQGLARYKAFMEINDALTALKESKFIISQPKMNTVLKIITDNDVLFGLVNECNENFDYDKEYKRAVTSFKDGERFILPSGRKKVIALVTGLLFEFNMKTIQIGLAAGSDASNKFLRSDAFFLRGDHHRGAVCVIGADKANCVAIHSLSANPNVCLNIFHDMTDVKWPVRIGQSGRYKDLTFLHDYRYKKKFQNWN